MMFQHKTILLTFDVEDWFQVENLRPWKPFSTWDSLESRVERNTHHILDLLDSIQLKHGEVGTIDAPWSQPKATFFVLGWIANRFPNLLREIDARGHEVASHGFEHQLCYTQSEAELENDLISSKKLIEDLIGQPVWGYRAPSFSISDGVMKIIRSCGYQYDSSFNSFDKHGRYGHINTSQLDCQGSIFRLDDGLFEIPLSNLFILRTVLPWAGGGYFRFIPFCIFKRGVEKILQKNDLYVFYAHPWEFDPHQPVVEQVSMISKFKHYVNLAKTSARFKAFLDRFSSYRFLTCHSYLQETWGKYDSTK